MIPLRYLHRLSPLPFLISLAGKTISTPDIAFEHLFLDDFVLQYFLADFLLLFLYTTAAAVSRFREVFGRLVPGEAGEDLNSYEDDKNIGCHDKLYKCTIM